MLFVSKNAKSKKVPDQSGLSVLSKFSFEARAHFQPILMDAASA
jgi:hypothetical protein